MYPPTTQLEAVLRRALRRAGIVQGYLHLEPGYLRREIDLLSFAPSAAAGRGIRRIDQGANSS
jgi:hypothetical protein